MVELTDREKKIVLIKFIMHGMEQLPVENRVQILKVAMKLLGMNYNEQEMFDINDAVAQVQQSVIGASQGFLKNNKDLVDQGISMLGSRGDRLKF